MALVLQQTQQLYTMHEQVQLRQIPWNIPAPNNYWKLQTDNNNNLICKVSAASCTDPEAQRNLRHITVQVHQNKLGACTARGVGRGRRAVKKRSPDIRQFTETLKVHHSIDNEEYFF